MSVSSEPPLVQSELRQLPAQLFIPPIRGEMVHLRPASVEDLSRLDELEAFYNASGITGKDVHSERAIVQTWVKRSVAWSKGLAPSDSGVGDPEARRTIAWSILTDADHDADGQIDAANTDNVIGMIFLIDIDGWARSARIQVILGKDYRGRGYSRDAMPRVMTYGFASTPAGLGLHRIWVSVPEKNTRSLSVYQSLGFVPSGTARDGLWDAEVGKYQDLIVMDTLADEYDPIRSLDAFGMHMIEDNPGVQEALSAREHSIAIKQKTKRENAAGTEDHDDNRAAKSDFDGSKAHDAESHFESVQSEITSETQEAQDDSKSDVSNWPFSSEDRKGSKDAWWRTLGRSRKRGSEGEIMSAEDLDNYETDAELALYKEYRDVIKLFTYVVETERRFYLANKVDFNVRSAGQDVYFDVQLTDAWVWDVYRSSRFVKNVRIVTFKDVNVEEVQKTDIDIPDALP
ncbi:acetyltransferase [Bifidobacterium tsurumiense]|uniref:Acetyltransferase n=3 Tax=Bifidobacterium TaxID=1678 RepID=A0A087EHZ4_9BIFI|nr:acetyltransferase [Bifidobacterium tsurumiense]